MAKWPPHEPPRQIDPTPALPHGGGREEELPPEPIPEPEPPYIYPGDGEHLQAAIDAAAYPVTTRAVRGLKPYHDVMHALASASVNPADGENILLSVRPHLATLQVAYDAALAATAEVAEGLGLSAPAVLGDEHAGRHKEKGHKKEKGGHR